MYFRMLGINHCFRTRTCSYRAALRRTELEDIEDFGISAGDSPEIKEGKRIDTIHSLDTIIDHTLKNLRKKILYFVFDICFDFIFGYLPCTKAIKCYLPLIYEGRIGLI